MSSNCIFCKIAAKNAEAEIKYEDDELLVFADIKPAAKYHYLAIPKEHIDSVNSLSTPEHKGIFDRLIAEGKNVIQQEGGDINDIRLGFHLPPFNSVGHLHLHVISPASNLSFISRLVFRPHTWWFASAEEIQEKLHKLENEHNQETKTSKL